MTVTQVLSRVHQMEKEGLKILCEKCMSDPLQILIHGKGMFLHSVLIPMLEGRIENIGIEKRPF